MEEESTETKPVSNTKMQKSASFTEIKSMSYGMPFLNKILSKNVFTHPNLYSQVHGKMNTVFGKKNSLLKLSI